MPEHPHPYQKIESLLASHTPEEVHQGLELVRQEIARIGSSAARPLFEMVTSVFNIDMLDHPEMVPVVNEAVSLVVGFGDWVIPELLRKLDAGDFKAQLTIGHALGRIGADAIQPLIAEYQSTDDPEHRVFILYALGKIKSPRILEALPLALEVIDSPNLEVRDTATRAIGKFAESIPSLQANDGLRRDILDKLKANLSDTSPGIRAKAVRSLGKLAKFGHLTPPEREWLKSVCEHLAGTDERYEWDYAFIVRREAEEALH